MKEGVEDEEGIADAKVSGIWDGSWLFVAVINLGGIDEFWQSFEDVALV